MSIKVATRHFVPIPVCSGLFVSLVLLASSVQTQYGIAPLVVAAAVSLSAYFLLLDVISKSPRPFRLGFSIFFTLFFMLPAYLHLLWYGFPFYGLQYRTGSAETAAWISLACLVAVYSSYAIFSNIRHGHISLAGKTSGIEGSVPAFACLAFSGLSMLIVYSLGIDEFFLNRGESQLTASIDLLVLSTAARAASFIAILYATFWRGSVAMKTLLIAVCLVVFMVVNNPLSIARFFLFGYVFAFFLAHSKFGRVKRSLFVCAIILGLVTVFPLASAVTRGDTDVEALITEGRLFYYYATSGDFDGFQSTMNVVRYVDGTGFKYGNNILSALLVFVPRQVWSGKSPGTGVDAAEFAGYPFTNISAPIPAELYVDFGWVGLIFGGIALGFLLNHGDWMFVSRNSDIHRRVMLAICFGFLIILLRGSLVAVIAPVGLILAVQYAFSRACELRWGRGRSV